MMPSPACALTRALLDFIAPFQLGSGRMPTPLELIRVEEYATTLERNSPSPQLGQSFSLLEGMWRCLFTTSSYVLGLNNIPLVNLSGVYQRVHLGTVPGTGYYFNIGELSRGGSVKLVCGEHAHIETSAVPNRIDLRYDYFYFAPRLAMRYEGHFRLADGLTANRLAASFRLPFRKPGWQSILYLDSQLRVVRGNEGGLFVLVKESPIAAAHKHPSGSARHMP
jgi:hypothetical protein